LSFIAVQTTKTAIIRIQRRRKAPLIAVEDALAKVKRS